MASNRMYLRCTCDYCEEKNKEFYLAKYYPDSGWYHNSDELVRNFYKYMDKHKHKSIRGDYFKLIYESDPGEYAGGKIKNEDDDEGEEDSE